MDGEDTVAEPFTLDLTDRTVVKILGYHSSPCGYCKPRTRTAPKSALSSGCSNDTSDISSATPADAQNPGDGEKIETLTTNANANNERPSRKIKRGSLGHFYLLSPQLTVQDYQALLEYGWRRSGKMVYLPDSLNSCCVHYPIRLSVSDFRPSREHRQALHRWNRFVLGPPCERAMNRAGHLKRKNSGFDLSKTVHLSKEENIPDESVLGAVPSHRFQTMLEPASYSDEKFRVFKTYQVDVHEEDEKKVTQHSFRQFLCSTPLFAPSSQPDCGGKSKREEYATSLPSSSSSLRAKSSKPDSPLPSLSSSQSDTTQTALLGTYHLCFYLDDQLLGVSVLDLLPDYVSSVYFFYDSTNPLLHGHSLGKISALHEFDLAQSRGYQYYCMGFIIWQCPKMRYKAGYRPQQILDWHTRTWVSLEDEGVQRRLDLATGKEAKLTGDGDGEKEGEREGRDGLACMTTGLASTPPTTSLGAEAIMMLHNGKMRSIFDLPACIGTLSAREVVELVDMNKLLIIAKYEGEDDEDDNDEDADSDVSRSEHQSDHKAEEKAEESRLTNAPHPPVPADPSASRICTGLAYHPAAFLPWIEVRACDEYGRPISRVEMFGCPRSEGGKGFGLADRAGAGAYNAQPEWYTTTSARHREAYVDKLVEAAKRPSTLNCILAEFLALVGPVVAARAENGDVVVAVC